MAFKAIDNCSFPFPVARLKRAAINGKTASIASKSLLSNIFVNLCDAEKLLRRRKVFGDESLI